MVAKRTEAGSELVLEVSIVEVGKLRLKCDGTRSETQISSFGETDESI